MLPIQRTIARATTTLAILAVAACGTGSPSTPSAAPTASGPPQAPTSLASPQAPAASNAAPPAVKEDNPPGDIPDTQAFVPYTFPSGAFSITVPEGWARTDASGSVTFTSHFNSARLEIIPAPIAPTVASARSTEAPAVAAAAAHGTVGPIAAVTRPAGAAVLINYQADSAPDPVTGHYARVAVERYEFWRNGIEAVVSLSAPVGGDNVDPWKKITDSFRWS